MYKKFIMQDNFNFVERAIRHLAVEIGAEGEEDGSFWVCYGSFVLNRQTSESDLDLLCIHNRSVSIRRIQSSFEGYPVTVYSLCKNDFASDGEARLFGGYFSGKVLNPYVAFLATQEDEDFIMKAAGQFIGYFAAVMAEQQGRRNATRTNLVADSVLARFHLCPWYQSYFLRYYTASNFSELWRHMEEVIPLMFVKAKAVIQNGSVFEYQRIPSKTELHMESIKVIARFWALGSCLHGQLPDFPNYYIQKTEQFIVCNNLQGRCAEMLQFLCEQSVQQKKGGLYGP